MKQRTDMIPGAGDYIVLLRGGPYDGERRRVRALDDTIVIEPFEQFAAYMRTGKQISDDWSMTVAVEPYRRKAGDPDTLELPPPAVAKRAGHIYEWTGEQG